MNKVREKRASIAYNDSADRFSTKFGVDVFLGHAKFLNKNTIDVNGQQLLYNF